MGIFDFLKKNKNVENDNGLNETFRKKGGRIKERFYKENGVRHGKYEAFYDDVNQTTHIIANYNFGKIHGECRQWSILQPFGGGCWRYIENYENGELRNRKVYTAGSSKPLDPIKKIRTLVKEENFETGNSEKGLIEDCC
jgi:hypothetical protein